MEHPNDIWFRRIGIPVLLLFANLFYLDDYQYNGLVYLGRSAIGILFLTPVWALFVQWLLFVRQRYQGIGQIRPRVIITFAGYFVITTISLLIFLTLIDWSGLSPVSITQRSYIIYILIGFGCTVVAGSVYEIMYYLHLYRLAVTESEAVQQASLKSQFDSLKTQVNPHFLFNCLNSLSALIHEDRARAGLFLDELATVYRYLLQTNQQHLVPLNTEINFARSFLFLLKTRFGPALDYDIQVESYLLDYLVPPLVVQTLVENAIRHNVVEAEQPLYISIETIGGSLIVTNSIQRKNRLVASQPGLSGLSHLTDRLQALKLPLPRITDNGLVFSVWLPLTPKNQASFTKAT